jgi:hypothetical protein
MSNNLSPRIALTVLLFGCTAGAGAQAPSAPGKPLPPGPMQAKIKAACTQCHNASRITEQHLTRKQWSVELDKMDGLGAVIADGEREQFLNYLTKNFGPENGGSKRPAKKSSSPANQYDLRLAIPLSQ